MWGNTNTHSLLVRMQNVQPLWKTLWQFLRKLNTLSPYDPEIKLFGIYPKELKTSVHTHTHTHTHICCTWIFIAAFFFFKKVGKLLLS